MSEYQYYEFIAIDRPLNAQAQAEVRALSTRAEITATRLSSIVGIRDELAAGDHRALYLAWLAGYVAWEHAEDAFDQDEDDELEPPVPPGLGTLTAPQHELADFLRVDEDLLAVAAEASPPLDDPELLAAWLTTRPTDEKDRLLLHVAQGRAAIARMEILRRFRDATAPAIAAPGRRTVADLLDGAWQRRGDRQHQEAAQRAEDEARREHARALARQKRLVDLSHDEEAAWVKVEALVATRKPTEYDTAVALLRDLQALAERDDHFDAFTLRSKALRHAHARKPSLIERLNRANL